MSKRALVKVNENGSKWAAQAPDPIEKLFERLEQYALDPRTGPFMVPARGAVRVGRKANGETLFKDTGPIHPKHPKAVSFGGNFFELSAGFDIDTDDKKLIARLTKAIQANQRRASYRAAKRQIAA